MKKTSLNLSLLFFPLNRPNRRQIFQLSFLMFLLCAIGNRDEWRRKMNTYPYPWREKSGQSIDQKFRTITFKVWYDLTAHPSSSVRRWLYIRDTLSVKKYWLNFWHLTKISAEIFQILLFSLLLLTTVIFGIYSFWYIKCMEDILFLICTITYSEATLEICLQVSG